MQIVKVQLKAINSSGLLFVVDLAQPAYRLRSCPVSNENRVPTTTTRLFLICHSYYQSSSITYNIIIIAQTTPPPADDDDSFVSHSQSYTEQYELYILLFAIIARHQPTTTTLLSGDQPSWERNKVQPTMNRSLHPFSA